MGRTSPTVSPGTAHGRRGWMLGLGLLFVLVLGATVTRGLWTPLLGRSLVCRSEPGQVDAILVDSLDQNYLTFERAAELRRNGLAAPVYIPARQARGLKTVDRVSERIVRVMADVASLRDFEIIPFAEEEPITLNAAYQIRDYLLPRHVKSVLVVAPALRSRRSKLVYGTVFGRAGVDVRCEPVQGAIAPEAWAATWHGIQGFVEQYMKLQYYRLYVLPFRAKPEPAPSVIGRIAGRDVRGRER
jgi:hypothetical protein